mmetsp:Transcript_65829/g.129732  ORF Transcript_65829/g.129732 Transcript_65829/m.129732 type:complete len:142 (+) Transcript_65829:63-488(+)
MSQLSGLSDMQSASDQDDHRHTSRKVALVAGLVAVVLAVVVIAGTAHNPLQTWRIAASGQIVNAFSAHEGVAYAGGDLFQVNQVESAQVCGGICCNVPIAFMITVKPDSYHWWPEGKTCWCKSFFLTHPIAHVGVSGKCTR